jgi:hypothetical protein
LAPHYVWTTRGRRLIGGWPLAGSTQWQSGQPFSIYTDVDSNGDGCCANFESDFDGQPAWLHAVTHPHPVLRPHKGEGQEWISSAAHYLLTVNQRKRLCFNQIEFWTERDPSFWTVSHPYVHRGLLS